MKIVCEACQAKYSISDDKVRGKAFKIRCKKCSHIIVVRAADGGGGPAQSMEAIPSVSSADVPAQLGAAETTWHIVVDGEQVGPLPESDIRGRLARGEVTADTYIWREGLADWGKISAVSDFANAFSGGAAAGYEDGPGPFGQQPSTAVYPPGTAENAFASSAGPAAEADVFAAPAHGNSSVGADLFSAPAAEPAAPAMSSFSFGGGRGGNAEPAGMRGANGSGAGASVVSSGGSLTGQRHENSVLFSLSNLEALAHPSAPSSPAPKPGLSSSATTEGSGLIDIRSMAAMTLGRGDERSPSYDLPAFGAPQFSPVAPVLLPIAGSSGPPTWLYAVLGVLVLLAAGLGIATYKVFTTKPVPPAIVAPAPVAPTPAAARPAAAQPVTPPTTPPPASNEALPPREETRTAEKVDRGGPAKGGKASARDTKKGAKSPAAPVQAAAPAPAPAKEPEKPAKSDRLDDLLATAMGGKKSAPRADDDPAPAKKAEQGKPLPSGLSKEEVVGAMKGVERKAKDCFQQYKVPGVATFKVDISNGRVTNVNVTGKFAGTPTGSCVEGAVRGAKVPATQASTFNYLFSLN